MLFLHVKVGAGGVKQTYVSMLPFLNYLAEALLVSALPGALGGAELYMSQIELIPLWVLSSGPLRPPNESS